ncbi:uncharacterized protein L969DRAFT_91938 [Mixia osmundae IAM 14324]|uniref:Cwf19-like C-terminal domain-containing protein n=1 Tax=Mixia osmundae (strain CBS 9802 / IAM 14324 / JCM 22182 / KY 12970) TaxID=764103 RepID=G7E332_MIXOS|nr:uncharacterized protein L969DRAFT_91938 [Mixia osmundae IAM 14324]KEI42498.1 hypothetical protein L969DRAFT_91938 [Mixia osmundae IAM 14324]GAA97213.1 hypothetical protein E5Q_03889 [Mixia osmundae IAM 14324]
MARPDRHRPTSDSSHHSQRDRDEHVQPSRRRHDGDHQRKRRRHEPEQVEEDMWVEKTAPSTDKAVSNAPDPATLGLTSKAIPSHETVQELPLHEDAEAQSNDPWSIIDATSHVREKKPREHKPDPEKAKMSRFERNTGIYNDDGTRKADNEAIATGTTRPSDASASKVILPGSAGSTWRLAKLRRVLETADEEKRPLEEVALERYGSLQEFEQAMEEKRWIEEQQSRRRSTASGSTTPSRRDQHNRTASSPGLRSVFTDPNASDLSQSSSRAGSFRRPGEGVSSTPARNAPSQSPASTPADSRPQTPIPSVFTPPVQRSSAHRTGSALAGPPVNATRDQTAADGADELDPGQHSQAPLSTSSLNRLQAKALKAKLMGAPEAEELQRAYETAAESSRGGDRGGGYFGTQPGQHAGDGTEVHVLPTLDGYGRLYDIGPGSQTTEPQEHRPGNRKKKLDAQKFETRDLKTGEILRYNADDDSTTLRELVRQERFGAGSADQKSMDAEMASRIVGDAKFEDDLDYMDDNADKLARKKMRDEAQKRMFAINDYAKTKKALESCRLCYQDTETSSRPPLVPMIALGTRCYLSLPDNEGLTTGHCWIVPLQHNLSCLEGDDDFWDEVKNFMKTLMKMFAAQDKGVIFFETVLSLRSQRHSYIEAIPVPFDIYDDAPQYFKEAILAVESEWSQNKKLIDFASRPGGFRRAMVPNLPYFAVQWDYKGEKGYGHVIEGMDTQEGAGDGADEFEEAKGGGEFTRYFAHEIIGSLLELEPRAWRKPRRAKQSEEASRIQAFKTHYDAYDWTKVL